MRTPYPDLDYVSQPGADEIQQTGAVTRRVGVEEGVVHEVVYEGVDRPPVDIMELLTERIVEGA